MRIAIGGDFVLNDRLRELGRRWVDSGDNPGFEGLRRVFGAADYSIVNFEGCLAEEGAEPPIPDKILLHAGAESVHVARALGIDAVSLANNHAFDFGPSTREVLEQSGVGCFGGGRDQEQATEPLIREICNQRVAFLAWVSPETIVGRWAGPGRYGANALPQAALVEQVRRLASDVDRIVVVPHWGWDYVKYPSASTRALARELIEAGADAVIGTHPHVIGCLEWHRERPIVYSTGTLLLESRRDPAGAVVGAPFPPFVSIVALLDFSDSRVQLDVAGFRYYNGDFREVPAARAWRLLRRNSRFLEGSDYARRYARYEARMRSWGIRLRVGVLSPPGPFVRIALKLRRDQLGASA